jgi:hypothetical protein
MATDDVQRWRTALPWFCWGEAVARGYFTRFHTGSAFVPVDVAGPQFIRRD